MLPELYSDSAADRRKAAYCISRKPKKHTVCTVIRHIYSSTKDKSVRSECLRAVWNAKELNRVLKHYNKRYTMRTALGWWRKNPYSPKTFTESDESYASDLLQKDWNRPSHALSRSFVYLYNICPHRLKRLCLEGLWMSSRMLIKFDTYYAEEIGEPKPCS